MAYHKTTAVVAQEPSLFSGTIRENITFGLEDQPVAQEELEAAARLANAHEFISKFAKGYDTQVGQRGVRLSGGQKQRLAIARAVLTKPRLLILDEATSALDAESEHLVQEALERIMVGRTTLVIAHRLSTIQKADVILVVDEGRIVQRGSHDTLLQDPAGVYARLVAHQLKQ